MEIVETSLPHNADRYSTIDLLGVQLLRDIHVNIRTHCSAALHMIKNLQLHFSIPDNSSNIEPLM